jgi:hypothetical protein
MLHVLYVDGFRLYTIVTTIVTIYILCKAMYSI